QALTFRNDELIQKTVRLLNVQSILPLLEHLNNYLYESAEKGLIASKWLRVVLSTHTSYLMTCSDISERLGPLYELIEARTKLYPKLSRLHGKLMLIASQMTTQNDILCTDEISSQPRLIFEELSDEDDEQVDDDIVPSPSEYEDYSGLSDDLDLLNDEDENENEDFDEEENKSQNNNSDYQEMLIEHNNTLSNYKSKRINQLPNTGNNNKHNTSDLEEDEEDMD
ncbi:unnamed protein product, partial [Didymodactylos carnosus]